MDSFWQQHRTFVLKILAGLAVVLVCWIIGSSFTDKSLSDRAATNEALRKAVDRMKVPDDADTAAFEDSVGALERRVHSYAAEIGKVSGAAEFRREIIRDILEEVEKTDPSVLAAYTSAAGARPLAVVEDLKADARDYLNRKAGMANVLLPDDFGSVAGLDASQVDRYLIALELAIRAVKLAIGEGLFEVKSIEINTMAGSRFEDEEEFIRQFPVTVEVRGPAVSVLGFLEKLNDPGNFIPVEELMGLAADRNERDPSIQTAKLRLLALRIDLGSGVEE